MVDIYLLRFKKKLFVCKYLEKDLLRFNIEYLCYILYNYKKENYKTLKFFTHYNLIFIRMQ